MEMLVVSALIALFSGLAVFAITTQLEQNKKKAAVAECRQIATAMSFAHQDLGFFPKFCFMKFNFQNIAQFLIGASVPANTGAVEYHGHAVPNLGLKLRNSWKGVYMTQNPDRLVKMVFNTESGQLTMPWPADPWGNPYVAYLIHTEKPVAGRPNAVQKFLQNSGQDANYYAGITSYGRNTVPGLGDDAVNEPDKINQRKPLRLYQAPDGTPPGTFFLLTPAQYTDDKMQVFLPSASGTTGYDGLGPNSLDKGSDDRVYQF